MRRTDREITDRKLIDEIIHGSPFCHVGLARGDVPYVVAMSFGYDGAAVYLHTAPEGRKIVYFETGAQVCVNFERNVALKQDAEVACKWSFSYESVIGTGTISEVKDPAEKTCALNEIMKHYSGRTWSFPEGEFPKMRVWKIVLASLTGKISKSKHAPHQVKLAW